MGAENPAGIPLAPIPTSFEVGEGKFGSVTLLALAVNTPAGKQTFFLDYASARSRSRS